VIQVLLTPILYRPSAPLFRLEFAATPADVHAVEWNNRMWMEYVVDESTTMTVVGESPADCAVWLCGGGGGGGGGYKAASNASNEGGGGGGGGRCTTYMDIRLASGAIVIGAGGGGGQGSTVGAADAAGQDGGVTRLSMTGQADCTANGGDAGKGTWGGNGGSGGGQGGYSDSAVYVGLGDGATTIPFGDSANWERLCAGGGGAAPMRDSTRQYPGGAGGSNGDSGKAPNPGGTWAGAAAGGAGGDTGGGSGGNAGYSNPKPGADAAAYGSGGGGGSVSTSASAGAKQGGAGYKGVVIIRIPIETTEIV
jgi:hypothetical protein